MGPEETASWQTCREIPFRPKRKANEEGGQNRKKLATAADYLLLDISSDSEDGGVLLPPLSEEPVTFSKQHEPDGGETVRVGNRYYLGSQDSYIHQDKSLLTLAERNLWTVGLPDTSALDLKRTDSLTPAEEVFVNIRRVLREKWKCTPEEAIPHAFKGSTPYSLALLFKMRSLAGRVKSSLGGRELAEEVLLEQRRARLESLGLKQTTELTVFTSSLVPRNFGKAGHPFLLCEKEIVENVYGLTLQDAILADRWIMEHKRAVKKSAKTSGAEIGERSQSTEAVREEIKQEIVTMDQDDFCATIKEEEAIAEDL